MRKRFSLISERAAVSLLFFTSLASAAPASTVDVWVRTPGSYGTPGAEPAKTNLRKLEIGALAQQQITRSDVQYDGQEALYRGVALRDIIAQYRPPAETDLLLLHCRNGMIVPLPFRDARTMDRLDPFVALAMRSTPQAPLSSAFPPVSRHIEGYADIRQVTFADNKLVVKDRFHPDVPIAAQEQFTPWARIDSLVGIEFAEEAAYYRQFIPSADVRSGAALFRESCQFCHGVHKVGARYGWDYAQPLELHTYRSDASKLYYHIRYRVEYRATWQQMPALKHVSEKDAGLLWDWMRAVSTAPINRYSPTH